MLPFFLLLIMISPLPPGAGRPRLGRVCQPYDVCIATLGPYAFIVCLHQWLDAKPLAIARSRVYDYILCCVYERLEATPI